MMRFQRKEFNFTFDSWTISGMSNGGTFSSNLMSIFHKYLDGVGIWSGESVTYKNDTQANFLNGKPVYIYHGIDDQVFPITHGGQNKQWFNWAGGEVRCDFIAYFDHILPNNLPEHLIWNPYRSCSEMVDDYSSNCGYDVALNTLEHLYGVENFNSYREMNYQKKHLAVLYTFD